MGLLVLGEPYVGFNFLRNACPPIKGGNGQAGRPNSSGSGSFIGTPSLAGRWCVLPTVLRSEWSGQGVSHACGHHVRTAHRCGQGTPVAVTYIQVFECKQQKACREVPQKSTAVGYAIGAIRCALQRPDLQG